MVDAQHDGEEQRQEQPIGGVVAVGYVAALEAVVRAPAVEHAAAVSVRTGVQDVAPVGPGHRRGDAADYRSHDRRWVQKG